MNPLYVYFHAKDIPQVQEELKKIDFVDKLILKYYKFPQPHKIAFDYLMEHPEYSHIIIAPVDLVVTPEKLQFLLQRVSDFDYEIYSGVCNVDQGKHKDKLACTSNLPDLDPNSRRFYWYSKNKYDVPFRVMHVGFSCTIIKRKVIFDIMQNKMPLYHRDEIQFSADLQFSHNVNKLGYRILCDPRANFEHLRYQGELLAGIKEPSIEFIRKKSQSKP